jgi:hypothetical protein
MAFKFNPITSRFDLTKDDTGTLDSRYVNVTGDTMTGDLTMDNDVILKWKDSVGASQNVLQLDSSDILNLTNGAGDIYIQGTGRIDLVPSSGSLHLGAMVATNGETSLITGYFGVYDGTRYYGIAKNMSSFPASGTGLGGYFDGMGIKAIGAGTNAIFNVQSSTDTGNGPFGASFTVRGNHTVSTYYSILDDSNGSMLLRTYLRVGSTSAPTNTTTGDLTVVRLKVGDAAFQTNAEMDVTGDAAFRGSVSFIPAAGSGVPNNAMSTTHWSITNNSSDSNNLTFWEKTVSTTTARLSLDHNGTLKLLTGRLVTVQGVDVASANNLALGNDGNVFEITGTTQINLLSNVGWQNGSMIVLLFTTTPTVKHNQTTSGTDITIQLSGGADFAATAGDTLTLVLSEIGGTQAWRELCRTVI